MTTPVIDDIGIDDQVDDFSRCECIKFPDVPCDNDWDSIDGLCIECRPRCWAKDIIARFNVSCCGAAPSCQLVPLLNKHDQFVHVREGEEPG